MFLLTRRTRSLYNYDIFFEFGLAVAVTAIATALSLLANCVVKKVSPMLIGEKGVLGEWVKKIFK
jgi:hypothetical protein